MSLFDDPRWAEAWGHLGDYLGSHVRVSVAALVLGLAVSLPLAIAARDRPVMRSLLLGLVESAATVKLIKTMLYGTRPFDPAIFVAVSATLLAVAALACAVPAWRASRLDPMWALRAE